MDLVQNHTTYKYRGSDYLMVSNCNFRDTSGIDVMQASSQISTHSTFATLELPAAAFDMVNNSLEGQFQLCNGQMIRSHSVSVHRKNPNKASHEVIAFGSCEDNGNVTTSACEFPSKWILLKFGDLNLGYLGRCSWFPPNKNLRFGYFKKIFIYFFVLVFLNSKTGILLNKERIIVFFL